ncbi:hypothetical protein QVD17_31408 [Tagetes erecta]|uniref:Uncharacterized protein n=1 Tax=Tagetes erecta TaxID=13708 RepID=A0AAD8K3C6_TARER|nr:hypothetical protein QVD17_31408 [Tagetes erecta]
MPIDLQQHFSLTYAYDFTQLQDISHGNSDGEMMVDNNGIDCLGIGYKHPLWGICSSMKGIAASEINGGGDFRERTRLGDFTNKACMSIWLMIVYAHHVLLLKWRDQYMSAYCVHVQHRVEDRPNTPTMVGMFSLFKKMKNLPFLPSSLFNGVTLSQVYGSR